jgi:GNAT superfamily N-acetyltransferase
MSQLLDTLSNPAVVAALETSFYRAFTRLFATEISQNELDNPAIPLRYVSGIPFPLCNGVLRVNFSPEEADRKITETLDYFKSRQLPMTWFVFPSSQPADLGERLVAHGLTPFEKDTGMEFDLTTLAAEETLAPGLEIKRVANEATLQEWVQTNLKGYGLPEFLGEMLFAVHLEVGFSPDAPWQNFLAYLDGKPVATSTVFFSDGIAGIYSIATLEEVRGHGIGRAITRSALLWGRDKGFKIAVLEASAMGYNVYRKIGFTENCKVGQYIWTPEPNNPDGQ